MSNEFIHAVTIAVAIVLSLTHGTSALPALAWGQIRHEVKPPVKSFGQEDELAAFLAAPIDLAAFKRSKGASNSGSLRPDRWFYRPKEPGFFYQYMLFRTPKRYSEVERFGGFSIVVYKFGRKVGDYFDTNETLVAIWCRLKDPDLGRADLVGTPVPDIIARFGEPYATVGDVLVYHRRGRALSVHAKDGTVDWFKYVRLSREFDGSGRLPELLLRPGHE